MKTPKTKASTPRPPAFQVALIGELSILNKTLKALLAEEIRWHKMIYAGQDADPTSTEKS